MPPKKKVVDEAAETGGDGAFRWTPENERALFVLIIERQLTTDDYHKIVEALPPGANYNGVRQRISKLRKEQRERFTELGWDMPEGVAGKTPNKAASKTGTSKKRAAGGEKSEELGAEGETESPAKKLRARKGKKEVVKKEVEEDDGFGGEREMEGGGVKEELVEEDL